MKKIILIFFTFLGNYTAGAQERGSSNDSGNISQKVQVTAQPGNVPLIIVKDKPAVRLFPNPAKNKVELEIKGFDPGFILIQLSDANGKIVRNDKRLVLGPADMIVYMFSENPGVYFLLLKQDKKTVRTRLVIQ